MSKNFHNHRVRKAYELEGFYNGCVYRLSSNIPTEELAETLRDDYAARFPFWEDIRVKEYLEYHLVLGDD
jgi:hypothetical protein